MLKLIGAKLENRKMKRNVELDLEKYTHGSIRTGILTYVSVLQVKYSTGIIKKSWCWTSLLGSQFLLILLSEKLFAN